MIFEIVTIEGVDVVVIRCRRFGGYVGGWFGWDLFNLHGGFSYFFRRNFSIRVRVYLRGLKIKKL